MTSRFHLAALPLALCALVSPTLDARAQPVTSEGWAERSAGLEFYIEVPMIDSDDEPSGIGGNIVAESIINSVRYADTHPEIHHVVFKMNTGGGYLFHADAMADIIELHHDNTEYHIVIQDSISAGIWTAFSCDTIFMTRGGTIGGATAYITKADGTVEESADIPQIAARIALTAERNGHPGELIAPMMDLKVELHAWRGSDGEIVLSQEKPENTGSLTDYEQLDKDDTVLTLTTNEAIEIGLAQEIDSFDSARVGEYIGVANWTQANRYGLVIDEIGAIYNVTRAMEDRFYAMRMALPKIPVTSNNNRSRMIENLRDDRRKYGALLDSIRMINEALNELPNVHPERHIYLAPEGGKTVLADVEAWESDSREAMKYYQLLNRGLNDLRDAYRANEIDQDNLEDIEAAITLVKSRLLGITRYGNAAYWAEQNED